MKRELAKRPVDVALLAVDGSDAVLVKPYLGTIATYAGSTINDRQPRETLRDLEDVHFVDIPWLVNPDAKEFARISRPPLSSARSTASMRSASMRFARPRCSPRVASTGVEFDGATGHLTLDASRQFARESRALQFKGGQVVPAGSP